MGGNRFGSNSTLGVDKQKGLTADTDLQVGKNQTLHVSGGRGEGRKTDRDRTDQGGLGKENTFINDLAEMIRRNQEERRRKQKEKEGGRGI